MTFLDACAGIGGFRLTLDLLGVPVTGHGFSEVDKDAIEIYKAHWPEAVALGDLARWRDWGIAPGWLDIFSAGFPCPPFSVAGKRLGGDDPRNLWPVVAGAIRGLRPRHVMLENVPGILAGDGEQPAYFGRVLGDLAEAGYDAEWEVLSAREVGASHRRERVFIVAYRASVRFSSANGQQTEPQKEGGVRQFAGDSPLVAVAGCGGRRADDEGRQETGRGRVGEAGGAMDDADGGRCRQAPEAVRAGGNAAEYASLPLFPPGPADAEGWRRVLARWSELAPAIGGKLNVRFVEWLMGYPIGWTEGMRRSAALKALGNAVVPQCAAEAVRRMAP